MNLLNQPINLQRKVHANHLNITFQDRMSTVQCRTVEANHFIHCFLGLGYTQDIRYFWGEYPRVVKPPKLPPSKYWQLPAKNLLEEPAEDSYYLFCTFMYVYMYI